MNFPTPSGCRYPGSRLRRSGDTSFHKAWSRRSAALHYGAGSAATLFVPGNIAVGSFLAIRSSLTKPAPSSIFTNGSGKALLWAPTTIYVISADEKTSIQARRRKQPTLRPAPHRPTRVENEYFREGAWVYLAAWDVHRAKVFGRCEKQNGIAPVARLVGEVMGQEPYKSARRVFWILDNCSAHRGQKAADRLRVQWPNTILVHTPVHASWLNQVEIYFSIVQRKVLTPNDFVSLTELEQRLVAFQFQL